jgi:hypothetical protein
MEHKKLWIRWRRITPLETKWSDKKIWVRTTESHPSSQSPGMKRLVEYTGGASLMGIGIQRIFILAREES